MLKAQKDCIRRSLVLNHEAATLAQCQHEAFMAKTGGAQIWALDLLRRQAAMFTEPIDGEQAERSVSQIKAAIRQRLKWLGVASSGHSLFVC